jgi:hypothetical protein
MRDKVFAFCNFLLVGKVIIDDALLAVCALEEGEKLALHRLRRVLQQVCGAAERRGVRQAGFQVWRKGGEAEAGQALPAQGLGKVRLPRREDLLPSGEP